MNPGKPLHIGGSADAQTVGGQTKQRSITSTTVTDNSYVQPPSFGAVRQTVVSQPSGAGDHHDYRQPPSYNDVGRREGSQTGPAFAGNPVFDAEALAGMSLTASSFRKHNPNAFKKDNNAS